MKKAVKRGSKEWKENVMKARKGAQKGPLLRKARVSKVLSQSEIAKKVGISLPTYSRIELGRGPVKLARAEKISKLLKLTTVQAFKKVAGQKDKYLAK